MEDSALRVIRVLSNNAVVAQGATREHVLAGRGIGFGHRAGDLIDPKRFRTSTSKLIHST